MTEFESALELLVDRWRGSPAGPRSGMYSAENVRRTLAEFERSSGIRLPGSFRMFLIATAEIDTTLIEDCFTFRKAHELELEGSVEPFSASIVFADFLIESHLYVMQFGPDATSVFGTDDPDDVYESFEQFIIEFATWDPSTGRVDSNRPERAIDRYRSRSDALI